MSGELKQWPYGGAIPQRFSTNYHRYKDRGGQVDVAEDAEAYAGNKPITDVPRLMFFNLIFDQIRKEGVLGDFVEFGVYQGQTAVVLARNAGRLGRTVWLLDTYDGFDVKDFTGIDVVTDQLFRDTSLDAVRRRVGEANARYIQGYFPASAAQLPNDGQYALVHIDTDLYAPIMSGLEYFYPRVVPGGYIVVHDYGSLAWPGAEKAVDEFFADKAEGIIHIPDSAGSAVIRKARTPGQAPTWLATRQALTLNEWHVTGRGDLAPVLTRGWSSPEGWGIWGVGPEHSLTVVTPAGAALMLECDASAFVPPDQPARIVDVSINGMPAATWRFTREAQNDARALRLPPNAGPCTITFQPSAAGRVRDLVPGSKDERPLGMALRRLRIRVAEA